MSEKMNSTDLCPPFPRREAPRARRAAAEVAPGRGTPGPQQEIRTLFRANGKPRARCQDPCDSARLLPPQGGPPSAAPDALNYMSLLPWTGYPQKAGTASRSLLSSTACRQPETAGAWRTFPDCVNRCLCGWVGGWMDRWMDGRRTLGKEGGKEEPSYQRPTSTEADLKTSTVLKPRHCCFVVKSHLLRPRGL